MRRGYPTVVSILYMTVACQYTHCDWRIQHTTHPTVSTGIWPNGPVGPNPLPAAIVLLLKCANFWVANSLYLTIRINKRITSPPPPPPTYEFLVIWPNFDKEIEHPCCMKWVSGCVGLIRKTCEEFFFFFPFSFISPFIFPSVYFLVYILFLCTEYFYVLRTSMGLQGVNSLVVSFKAV